MNHPQLPALPPRAVDGHKGTYGTALLIGGSRGMAGSIALSGMAAARTGAGLVRLAVPDRCLETVASYSPCLMTIPLHEDLLGRIATRVDAFHSVVDKATCIAIGPGLGVTRELQVLLQELLQRAPCPLIVDADGLNNLAHIENWHQYCQCPVVVTPHPGEWSRLSGVPANRRDEQIAAAISFAKQHHVVVVLKGHHTVITDGRSTTINTTGTPAMATGGSGDVLTGVIAALICQGLEPRDAAHLGVYAHGKAAEHAQHKLQSHVVLPTDLIEHLARGLES
ncbi:MAG: NAD(P)H-hydrate dehydratase [Pirellulaceae bacterium]